MLFRLLLIAAFIPLQACSNTRIGEKLENSFDTTENQKVSVNMTKAKDQDKLNKIKKIKSSKIDDDKENKNFKRNITKKNSTSNKDRFNQKSTKSIKKVIFKPQPYRIILKLSGSNPSAPAESLTNALRNAGVQFEVEKIERFEEDILLKNLSRKRKEF
tara:strand:- start:590 stop:1066 length:477 start_codon:yes stop_codon:yes gene_type:complete